MKRILTLILVIVLALSVLVGCKTVNKIFGKDTDDNQVDDNQKPDNETPDDQKPSTPAATLDDAVNYLNLIYKDMAPGIVDYDIVGQVDISGVLFSVSWTTDSDKVSVRLSTKPGNWTVDLPESNDGAFSYTLTATVTDADGNSKQKTFTYTMADLITIPIPEALEAADDTQVAVRGTVCKIDTPWSDSFKNISVTIKDADGNELYLYRLSTKVELGDEIVVSGKMATYNGSRQIAQGATAIIIGHVDITINYTEMTIPQVLAAADGVAVKVTGTVHEINTAWSEDYGNITVTIKDDAGNSLYVYRLSTKVELGDVIVIEGYVGSHYGAKQIAQGSTATITGHVDIQQPENPDDPTPGTVMTIPEVLASAEGTPVVVKGTVESFYYEWDESYGNCSVYIVDDAGNKLLCFRLATKVAVGDQITVTGTATVYNGTVQIAAGCTATIDGSAPSVPSTSLGIVDLPEVGVAYKFGLFHGNESANVYFNGQNYNNYAWYLAYSTNAASAVDVYLEAVEGVEGGYRLYFMNGDTKTYIRVYQDSRDNHENDGTMELTTSVPEEYFTYSTEYKTLLWTNANGAQTYLGSSGTYKSISCSNISYIENEDSYISHFYAEGAEGGEDVGGGEDGGETPDTPAGPTEMTIPEVLASAEGTQVIVKGTVESFYYEWDESYGNCSVYIVDDAGNKLLCFRLKTKVAVGDQITVTGTATVYNGTIQIAAGCTATIDTPAGGEGGDTSDTPAGPTEMTIPEVLASAEGTQVIVKGTVSEFYQAWDPEYNNVSFYIVDEHGNRLLIFRTGTNVNIGDQVTVTGSATLYNTTIQIAQGSTTVVDVAHVCSEFTEADCLNAAKCTVCGTENGTALGHKYTSGACERCGASESAKTTVASKNMSELITSLGWTNTTTKQSFNLDDNVTVKVNGGSNTGKAYNGDHIRIYATDSPAGTLTISVGEGYELVSVKVTTQTGTYAFLCLDGSNADADISNQTVAISGSSVVLTSVKNGSEGKQVRVMAIEVTYKEA